MTKLASFRERYRSNALPELRRKFGYTNPHQFPRVVKVVINVGVGGAARDAKELENATNTLAKITGQKPVLTKAKSSIASFKIRAGMPIGAMVSLRGKKMEHFLDKLMHIVLPRVRDFQGLSPDSFGKSGSVTLGLKEHLVFPEIASEDFAKIHGLAVTIVTTAESASEGLTLLQALGFPFRTS
ncbi:MAG: 50S ribosomal protein L5 [Candidatus Kerfeldbacteria bacterium]|nr:50S ribosomal protein L5 [Candidatus Kerfeldbacteria bacterium]